MRKIKHSNYKIRNKGFNSIIDKVKKVYFFKFKMKNLIVSRPEGSLFDKYWFLSRDS